MGQLFLIRHGQASFGSTDYDRLSGLGFRQAKLLGNWFVSCGIPVERAMAGTMRRHVETAGGWLEPFDGSGALRVADLATDSRLNEFDHAEVLDVSRHVEPERLTPVTESAGREAPVSSAELQRLFSLAMERWMSGHHDSDYRETWAAFRARCIDAFEELVGGTHPARAMAVFTSGGVIAAICQHLLDLTGNATRELNWSLANTGVTRVMFTKGRRGLGYLNSTAHFDWARAPEMVTYR